MNNFFKSIWFKCIACLLAIALVSGGLLTILSNLLYVSPEERTERAMAKIYGSAVAINEIIVDVDGADETKKQPIVSAYGELQKIYMVNASETSYDLVFQAEGYNGYKGGTITLWVKVVFENNLPVKIDKVILQSSDKQTLMSKIGGDFYNKFTLDDVTEDYKNGKMFTADQKDTANILNPVSGATYSANAGNNAVNCVIDFCWGNN